MTPLNIATATTIAFTPVRLIVSAAARYWEDADINGVPDTENGARRVLVSLGCHNVGDLASRYLPEIDPTEAQRGDVVMIKGELGPFLAIVDGRTAVGPAARGLTHTPVSAALRAWRVG